jgi:hypothetical protein
MRAADDDIRQDRALNTGGSRVRWTMALLWLVTSIPTVARPMLQQVAEFLVPEANQGVAVDSRYFYAVDSQAIGKYDKKTGTLVKRWEGAKNGPIRHLDGAIVMEGKLYAAHSNYPDWPMTSSLEIWDAETMEHVGSHSFGINWGSLTWADFYDGYWWMTFANYDRLLGPNRTPYGHTAATQMIKFTADFRMVESWVFPKTLLERFGDMSNSGGSWAADGFLYLTGHDAAELYRVKLPSSGSVLELVDIIPMDIRGQGIAWDRSEPGVIYGVVRSTSVERTAVGGHKVRAFKLTDR